MMRSRMFRITATAILIVMILFWLVKSVITIAAGDTGAVNDLIIIGAAAILFIVAWKRLVLGGLLISCFGVILAMYFFLFQTTYQAITPHLLFMCAPMAIAGLLFIEADWSSRKRN
jgi:hypothetical protein